MVWYLFYGCHVPTIKLNALHTWAHWIFTTILRRHYYHIHFMDEGTEASSLLRSPKSLWKAVQTQMPLIQLRKEWSFISGDNTQILGEKKGWKKRGRKTTVINGRKSAIKSDHKNTPQWSNLREWNKNLSQYHGLLITNSCFRFCGPALLLSRKFCFVWSFLSSWFLNLIREL